MKQFSYLLLFLYLLSGCVSWKNKLVSKGGDIDVIYNAINDFTNTSRLIKHDSIFSVSLHHLKENIIGVSIYGYINKLSILKDSSGINYSGLPTRFTEKSGNLFFWDDTTYNVSTALIRTYQKYNLIDTAIRNVYIPVSCIDERKKGVDYYFCKRNLLKYKKVKTNIALGYYKPPKLNCDE